jgi:P27 family predicted phage terminase small subunit
MPGPSPQPTALKILRGNPGRRPLNKREPEPEAKAPECPDYVKADPVALAYWEHYLPILLSMRILTVADETVLASLCITHSNLIANLNKVRELNANGSSGISGIVIATKTGYLAPNQFYLNVQTAMEQELKFCRELGLTPSARTRINTVSTKESSDDPWGKL